MSDGTAQGTTVLTNDDTPIEVVTGLSYSLDSGEVASKLKLEVALPALVLEVPMDNVEIEVATKRNCAECKKELSPIVTSIDRGNDVHESVVVYKCEKCNISYTYPFSFNWKDVPEDLSEYNDA